MIRGKKADLGMLALIILALASAAILGGFVYKWSVQTKRTAGMEACRLSILRAAQEKKMGFPGIKEAGTTLSRLKCNRAELGDVIIRKKDVVENDKINQDKAHKIIAEAMRECWYMAGEGLLDPFSYWSSDTYKKQSLCMICKTIIFDDDLVEWMGKKQKELIKNELGIDLNQYSNDENGIRALEQEANRLKNSLSEEKKEQFEEKYLDYVITSPIPYLQTKNIPKTKKTYWEYLYNEKAAKLSAEDEEKLRKTQVMPNSIILVRLYRTVVKDPWYWTALKWIGGIVAVIATVAFVAITLGYGAVVLAILKGTLGVLAFVIKSFVISAIIIGVGAAIIVPAGLSSYKYCPDCEGVGGVILVQPDIMPLDSSTKVCLQAQCEEKDLTEVKVCDLLVN